MNLQNPYTNYNFTYEKMIKGNSRNQKVVALTLTMYTNRII